MLKFLTHRSLERSDVSTLEEKEPFVAASFHPFRFLANFKVYGHWPKVMMAWARILGSWVKTH